MFETAYEETQKQLAIEIKDKEKAIGKLQAELKHLKNMKTGSNAMKDDMQGQQKVSGGEELFQTLRTIWETRQVSK